jgi:hypothetical protein
MTRTTSTRRTVTLTGRPPVSIDTEEWPRIAHASDDSDSGIDYARHQQSLSQGECDTYSMTVRRHADGRTLVYAVLDAAIPEWGAPAHGESRRGGELVPAGGADVASVIRRVGEDVGIPDGVIRDCIAALPAEKI